MAHQLHHVTRCGAADDTLCSAKEPAAARNIAFCIAQLSLSDKALRKLGDMWKAYHLALCDEAILGYFKVRGRPRPDNASNRTSLQSP